MPTPIQSSTVTKKLRDFFRLRGRQIFTLDETVVPTAQVEDLTNAPFRGSHQIRWMAGRRFSITTVPTRQFLILLTTARVGAAFVSLTDLPGVSVIESLTLRETDNITPASAKRWTVELVSHQGLLASVEFAAQDSIFASNVDSAVNTGLAAGLVQGQVPVALTGIPENIAPALGTRLRLGQRVWPDSTTGITTDILQGGPVVIGDNVALMLRTENVPTAGFVVVDVVGSFYPLARS